MRNAAAELRHFSFLAKKIQLYLFYLYRVESFFSFNDLVFNLVIFPDSKSSQSCHMDKDVSVCVVFNDEAVSLSFIEKFYNPCWHNVVNKKLNKVKILKNSSRFNFDPQFQYQTIEGGSTD